MITLAIDASTKSTGVAIFKNKELVTYDCFINNGKSVLKRIKFMVDKIEEWHNEFMPDQIILEQIIPDNLNEAKWHTNQNTFKALFYLQAAIVLMFDNYNKEVEFIGPTSWRRQCGIKQGEANRDILKERDKEFVFNNYKIKVNDDIADAICIGHTKVNAKPEPQPFNWE